MHPSQTNLRTALVYITLFSIALSVGQNAGYETLTSLIGQLAAFMIGVAGCGAFFFGRRFRVRLALIGLIVGVVTLRAQGPASYASVSEDYLMEQVLNGYSIRLQRYFDDMGDYPSTESGLAALLTNPPDQRRPGYRWKGPYTPDDALLDIWDRPFRYTKTGPRSANVVSLGSDGVAGTADDYSISVSK